MVDLDTVCRGAGEVTSRDRDTNSVLEFTEFLCDASELHSSGMEKLRGGLVWDCPGLGISMKRFRHGSKSQRDMPKQAMVQKIKIMQVAVDKTQ